MAGLELRNDSYRVTFSYLNKSYVVAIGKVSPEGAEAKCAQVKYLILRLKPWLIELPPVVDIPEFVLYDGKLSGTGICIDLGCSGSLTHQ